MSFGWSAGDVYALVQLCYKVAENCRDGIIGASGQVKNLQADVEDFSSILKQFQVYLSETGELAFQNLSEFEDTLKACSAYLDDYKYLRKQDGEKLPTTNGKDNRPRRPSWSKSKGVLQAVKWSTLRGDEKLQLLQSRLSQHRQNLVLYIQLLDRKRSNEESAKINKKLDVLAQDLRAHTRRASAASSSTDVALQNTYSDYESTLRTVSELQSLAVQGSQQAESDDQLQEWNNICSQLEMVHRRVLNTIERTVNSTAQSHEGSQTSLISLNRVLAARRNVVTSPSLYPIARNNTGDSGFFEENLPPLHEEKNGGSEETFIIPESPHPMTPSSLLFSRYTFTEPVHMNGQRTLSPQSSMDSMYYSQSSPPQATRPRSVASSETSFSSLYSHWEKVSFDDWVKFSYINPKTRIPCVLETGYDTDGRVRAVKVTDIRTGKQITILKLSSNSKRLIPHSEPPGERDNPMGISAYFIEPPTTEPPTSNVRFFFGKEKDHWKFQSLIYGQTLIESRVVQKIYSSNSRLSDSQYVRIWKSPGADSRKVLLFHASMKNPPRYIMIPANDVTSSTKKKKDNILDLKLTNNKHLKSLRLIFNCPDDLDKFSAAYLQ